MLVCLIRFRAKADLGSSNDFSRDFSLPGRGESGIVVLCGDGGLGGIVFQFEASSGS